MKGWVILGKVNNWTKDFEEKNLPGTEWICEVPDQGTDIIKRSLELLEWIRQVSLTQFF
jgi:hypothetical protein